MLAVANILLTPTGNSGDFRGFYEQSDSLEKSDLGALRCFKGQPGTSLKRSPKRKAARSNRARIAKRLPFLTSQSKW